MEEPLEQEHSMTNDDLKPSSSSTSTTAKPTRSTKQTTSTNGTTRRHKRRRQTNSIRSSSDRSTSSSRSSSSSSHSSHLSIKNSNSNDQELKKSRCTLAQEELQKIIEKTRTGKYDILDSFSFLTFETDDDWRIAFDYFHQQQLKQSCSTKKCYSLSGKKNGNSNESNDGHSLQRSISVPCKIEDGNKINHIPISTPVEENSSNENAQSLLWQNSSPSKISNDRLLSTTIKSEPIEKTNRSSRTTSEHDENHIDNENNLNFLPSTQKSNDEIKIEPNEKKHHHHHHHHHHKSHKRHKTKHDLSVNGDSSNKHPTITSMSDLAKQQIKHEQNTLPPSFNYPSHFDPKLFPLPSFTPFGPPPPPLLSGSYDPSFMLASRFYGGQYPRDLPMRPPSRPTSRSLQHPFTLKESHPDSSMEKMFEKYYPGVLPSYFAAAASAAAAASSSTTNNSSLSSLNVKMHDGSPHIPDHSLWSHREALQRQLLAASNKSSSAKSPLFDSNIKSSSNHSGPSPTDHHHHHRRHSSSTSNTDIPNQTTPTSHPLYLAPVIVTEYHQHQHNHSHTHEHKLNITTKDDRQSSPRSKTPLSNETKKSKSSFSVTDMFIDKTSPIMKHSPQQQGFLSVINNKKDTNQSSLMQLKKPTNGKWSTAHVHIAWMIYHHEQRQREKLNLNPTSKVRPSPTIISSTSQPTLFPPPLPSIDNNNDSSTIRPQLPPLPLPLPFDINSSQNSLFRSASATKLSRPTVTSTIKPSTIKREQKTPFNDERIRQTPPSPLSRSSSVSNFLASSPSHRMRMDFPSSLLLPPPQHQMPTFSLNDDRKRFLTPNPDLLQPLGPPGTPSPFLSSLFPMNPPAIPPPPLPLSSTSRRTGLNSDSSKSSLFPPPPHHHHHHPGPPMGTPFDFTRSPLLQSGLPLPTNHFESDRYRLFLEQQTRERDLQFAMMAAASSGNPSSLFTDPNSSALFKHY